MSKAKKLLQQQTQMLLDAHKRNTAEKDKFFAEVCRVLWPDEEHPVRDWWDGLRVLAEIKRLRELESDVRSKLDASIIGEPNDRP